MGFKSKEDTRKQIFPRKLFSNPLRVISFFVSVVSVILAIYFYNAAQENRELCLYVNPTKTSIVKSGQTSSLSISFKGEKITSDITAIQVVIWNRGEKSIRGNNILSPIVLDTNDVPILEAKVIKESRESIVGIKLDKSDRGEGKIGISWDIMEEDDGCIVQLICSGGIETNVGLEGTVEGQKRLTSIGSVPRKDKRDYISSLLIFLTSGCILIGFGICLFHTIATKGYIVTKKNAMSVVLRTTILAILLIIGGIYILTQAMKIEPPLPF